jgi:hypothetical protein
VAKKDEIRLIAYSIWEQEGCLNGKDCDHWFRAEAIWEERAANQPPKNIPSLPSSNKRSIRSRHTKK